MRSQFFYLYLILDVFSRKIVGWDVHDREGGEEAASLIQRTVLVERCYRKPLVLHADNGSPMKSQTMQTKLYDLEIAPSRSRFRASNDNPYSESLFRTLKHCPQWPSQGFESMDTARKWVNHLSIGTMKTIAIVRFPDATSSGQDKRILDKRDQLYAQVKAKHPARWSGQVRNWTPFGTVALNPERDSVET